MNKLILSVAALALIAGCSKKDDGGGGGGGGLGGPGGGNKNCVAAANCFPTRAGKPANLSGNWSGNGEITIDGKAIPGENNIFLVIDQAENALAVQANGGEVVQYEIRGNDLVRNGQKVGTIGSDGASVTEGELNTAVNVEGEFLNLYEAGTTQTQDGRKVPYIFKAKLTRQR